MDIIVGTVLSLRYVLPDSNTPGKYSVSHNVGYVPCVYLCIKYTN